MRQIRKLPEPESLTQHRATPGSTYNDYRDKQGLRDQLILEQRGLCCYCLCRIRAGEAGTIPPMKIAHWHSQRLHDREQLDYSNLLGACMGNQGSPQDLQHCDTSQGNRDIKWNPANPEDRIEDRIRYLADGTLESNDVEFNAQINTVLNLNKGFPKSNRVSLLDSFRKSLGKGQHTAAEWERKLQEWNGELGNGDLEPYCQIVVFWLRKRQRRT